jgi:hypothetical protein
MVASVLKIMYRPDESQFFIDITMNKPAGRYHQIKSESLKYPNKNKLYELANSVGWKNFDYDVIKTYDRKLSKNEIHELKASLIEELGASLNEEQEIIKCAHGNEKYRCDECAEMSRMLNSKYDYTCSHGIIRYNCADCRPYRCDICQNANHIRKRETQTQHDKSIEHKQRVSMLSLN